MVKLVGNEAIFYFSSGDQVQGVIKYVPVATGDCWIIDTEWETFYIQNYERMVIKKVSDEKR
jgi:hypothetical protein